VSGGAKLIVEERNGWEREMIGGARWMAEQFQFHRIQVVNDPPDDHRRCFSETQRMRLKAPLKRSKIGGDQIWI
jgi:hypothetical protein